MAPKGIGGMNPEQYAPAGNRVSAFPSGGPGGLNPSQSGASPIAKRLVRPAGLEPATPDLEGRCSIQMSYGRTTSW